MVDEFELRVGELSLVGKHAYGFLVQITLDAWKSKLADYTKGRKACDDPNCECHLDRHEVISAIMQKVVDGGVLLDGEVITLGYLEINSILEQLKPYMQVVQALMAGADVTVTNKSPGGKVDDKLWN